MPNPRAGNGVCGGAMSKSNIVLAQLSEMECVTIAGKCSHLKDSFYTVHTQQIKHADANCVELVLHPKGLGQNFEVSNLSLVRNSGL